MTEKEGVGVNVNILVSAGEKIEHRPISNKRLNLGKYYGNRRFFHDTFLFTLVIIHLNMSIHFLTLVMHIIYIDSIYNWPIIVVGYKHYLSINDGESLV